MRSLAELSPWIFLDLLGTQDEEHDVDEEAITFPDN
jgi:hypothetical protein